MTDQVNPSTNRPADSFLTASASIALAGGHGDGFVISDTPSDAATYESDIDETQLNKFAETSSSSSLDVTIDPGEAVVGGAWLARDVSTTVTLAASTNDQTVYVGWDHTATDSVIIGLDSAFAPLDQKIELYSYNTDASGVTN